MTLRDFTPPDVHNDTGTPAAPPPAPFTDPEVTAKGEARAKIALEELRTLWVNTGTLCNLACTHCYIESSPKNDRLAWFRLADLEGYLDEIRDHGWPTLEVNFTGGEPFMNPDIMDMLGLALGRGFRVLVLTNAMTPMRHHRAALRDLHDIYGDRLQIRVSVDHFDAARHDEERSAGSFAATLDGLKWLADAGFPLRIATRTLWGESDAEMRDGFRALAAREGLPLDSGDADALVVFPEMDETVTVPEITTACWGILGKNPSDIMCASARMVVRRKGADGPSVLACTLIAYDDRFELGDTLAGSAREVPLSHPHCARFCVLGGGACSRS